MQHLASSLVVGATGAFNGGLLATQALGKVQPLAGFDGSVMIAVAALVAGTALVGLFRSTVGMLTEPVEEPLI